MLIFPSTINLPVTQHCLRGDGRLLKSGYSVIGLKIWKSCKIGKISSSSVSKIFVEGCRLQQTITKIQIHSCTPKDNCSAPQKRKKQNLKPLAGYFNLYYPNAPSMQRSSLCMFWGRLTGEWNPQGKKKGGGEGRHKQLWGRTILKNLKSIGWTWNNASKIAGRKLGPMEGFGGGPIRRIY